MPDKEPGLPKETKERLETVERYKGSLVGAAVGDALGQPYEFIHLSPEYTAQEDWQQTVQEFLQKTREEFSKMQVHPFGMWRKGEYTDDTRQTLLLVDSLIEKGYDPEDFAGRLLQWFDHGRAKGLGNTTRLSLSLLEQGVDWGETGKKAKEMGASLSNGSLMRTSPIGFYFRGNPDEIDRAAAGISRITHAHEEAVIACQIASQLVGQLASGVSKEEALAFIRERYPAEFRKVMSSIVDMQKNPGGPYESLAIAISAFEKARSLEEAVLEAVKMNFGGDTDTYGTLAGAFAGAHWGVTQIPERWSVKLKPLNARQIEQKAERLYLANLSLQR